MTQGQLPAPVSSRPVAFCPRPQGRALHHVKKPRLALGPHGAPSTPSTNGPRKRAYLLERPLPRDSCLMTGEPSQSRPTEELLRPANTAEPQNLKLWGGLLYINR